MNDLEKAAKSLKKNPLLINIALGLLLFTNLLNLLAFSTTAWGRVYATDGGLYGIGLWRICLSGDTSFFVKTFCSDTTGWPQDWYAAAQFFAIVGFVGITGGLVSLLLYLCVQTCKGKSHLLFWTAIYILVTAFLYLIGIIIFGVEFINNYGEMVTGFGTGGLSWSFALAITADIFAIIVGVLLLYQSIKTRSTSPGKGKIPKPSNKSSKEKMKPQGNKNKNANKNANMKPAPVVIKSSSDQSTAKEAERNRKTSKTAQPNSNNKGTVSNQGQSKQQQPPRKYSQPAREPAREPRGQQRKSVGGQPREAKNATASPETKPENQSQEDNQQKKSVQPNLNAGPIEVQKAPATTTIGPEE